MYYIYGLLPCAGPPTTHGTSTIIGSGVMPPVAASTSSNSTVNTVNLNIPEQSYVKFSPSSGSYEVHSSATETSKPTQPSSIPTPMTGTNIEQKIDELRRELHGFMELQLSTTAALRQEMSQLTEQMRYLVQCQTNIAEIQQSVAQARDNTVTIINAIDASRATSTVME